jgi:hypothetical protein
VDDTFVIWPHGKGELAQFLGHLNNQNDSIRFTMEVEENRQLPFLDVLVTRNEDGTLSHSIYRKKTHTNRYLNAASHHHPIQKTSVIRTMYHRAFALADKQSLQSEKDQLLTTFQENGYQRSSIIKIAKKVETTMALKRTDSEEEVKEKPAAYAVIPYVTGVSEKISRILKKYNVVTRFKPIRKTSNILSRAKDRLSKDFNEGIYSVPCSCGSKYIGQTCRALKCRIQEHERAAKNRQFHLSAIAEHAWEGPEHTINFSEAKILHREKRYFPRLIREAVEITKTRKNFNRDDGYPLATTWKSLFQKQPVTDD